MGMVLPKTFLNPTPNLGLYYANSLNQAFQTSNLVMVIKFKTKEHVVRLWVGVETMATNWDVIMVIIEYKNRNDFIVPFTYAFDNNYYNNNSWTLLLT